MDTKNLRKRLRDEVTCSICLEYFTDPVILDCDHSFCRVCIARSWQQSCSRTLCPLCKQTMWSQTFKSNKHLASIAQITKQMNEGRKDSEGRSLCETHEEPLKLFCKDEKALICVVCDRSREHRDHNVLPVEEAAQVYKDQISESLKMLKKQREEILKYKSSIEEEGQVLLEQINTEMKNTVDILNQFSQFINKSTPSTDMIQVKEKIVKTKTEHQFTLAHELSSLNGIIQEMEELSQRPEIELLQDIEQTLKKGERKSFKKSLVFPSPLKLKIRQLCKKNSSLKSIIEDFKGDVAMSDILGIKDDLEEKL